jgi:hypothetical protein
MNLTESAVAAIVAVMNKKGLDPKEWFLEFRLLNNGAIGIGFTKTALKESYSFGELRLTIDGVIDTEGVIIDYGEFDDRKGLVFTGNGPPSTQDNARFRTNCGDPNCTCNGSCDKAECACTKS